MDKHARNFFLVLLVALAAALGIILMAIGAAVAQTVNETQPAVIVAAAAAAAPWWKAWLAWLATPAAGMLFAPILTALTGWIKARLNAYKIPTSGRALVYFLALGLAGLTGLASWWAGTALDIAVQQAFTAGLGAVGLAEGWAHMTGTAH